MIKADVNTDDKAFELEFDAEPWFSQASDDEIVELAACGWACDEATNAVAIWTGQNPNDIPENEEVTEMFSEISDTDNYPTMPEIECSIDEADARQWLEKNRSALLEVIDEAQAKGSW